MFEKKTGFEVKCDRCWRHVSYTSEEDFKKKRLDQRVHVALTGEAVEEFLKTVAKDHYLQKTVPANKEDGPQVPGTSHTDGAIFYHLCEGCALRVQGLIEDLLDHECDR